MNALAHRVPRFVDLGPDLASVRDAACAGLSRPRKELPAWMFYDARGSELFERICEQPEYYPTRTELAILRGHGHDIAEVLGERCCLIELGSGSNRKIRTLLGIMRRPDGYVAIDISGEQLRSAVCELARDFPSIPMTGIVADYGDGRGLPLAERGASRRIAFYPGSTVGNMHPHEAVAFLKPWRERLAGGGMLIGVDLVKDAVILDAAYDDVAGVTAEFNRNILVRLNRELGADFRPERFGHRAFFDPARSRVEMHLVSRGLQRARLGGRTFAFEDGETIHTENSYKYTVEGFRALAREAGFDPIRTWTDPRHLFSVHYLAAHA